jgi:uncharacterized protein with FMN-binding domain
MKHRTHRLITASVAAAALAVSTAANAQARAVAYGLSDGRYVGRREYAYYGFVRVEALVSRGRLSNVRVLEYPHDNGTSRYINGIALPYLVREAVHAQSRRVDLISGATFTSVAFEKSLADALRRAGQ